ncbi:unnamed protein product, partial [Laminaria digitata]
KVLPVGGIKEKTIAARRAGVQCLIFPQGNKRDYEELPEYLKDGLEASTITHNTPVHFASEYRDVFSIAFGEDGGGVEGGEGRGGEVSPSPQ